MCQKAIRYIEYPTDVTRVKKILIEAPEKGYLMNIGACVFSLTHNAKAKESFIMRRMQSYVLS